MTCPSTVLRLAFLALCYGAFVSALSAQTARNSRPMTASPDEKWVIRWNRSDDFNGTEADWKKWQRTPEQFSGWRWDNARNTATKEGHLEITLREIAAHQTTEKKKSGEPTRFTSGMLKSYAKGTYGYYEARIKGASVFPGASPAFWLYSAIDDTILSPGEVRYCEIDIVELTQRQSHKEGNERITDHNLHVILSNGKRGVPGREWRRPHHEAFREAQANEYRAPFDPREDFHTYGCLVGEEEIIWYIDGVEVGRKPNEFWHRPMNVALSLGLRAPYVTWQENKLVPNADAGAVDFPTSMLVDYVRVWELGDISKTTRPEQGGAGQPSTRLESK